MIPSEYRRINLGQGFETPREEFESLVLNLWLQAGTERELDASFDTLGNSLLEAQAEYLQAKKLDEDLFGDDYE